MRDFAAALSRFGASARSDVLLAFISGVIALGFLIGTALNGHQHWAALVFFGPYCFALAIRRRWPVGAAVLVAVAFLSVRPLGQAGFVDGPVSVALSWTPFLFGYTLGASVGLWAGLAGVLLILAGLQVENVVFNPIFAMITIGPWLAGRIAASRTRLTSQLEARNAELATEQDRFAAESVRLERARVARELHDVVAHCLAVIVVQAGAGQRSDAGGLTLALQAVAQAAGQAHEDITRLVDLLGPEPPDYPSATVALVDELVKRARATGLQVSCELAGTFDDLSAQASQAAFRVVQESLTNALKHAPGAPVCIGVRRDGGQLSVRIANSLPSQPPSGLERAGGQFGLAGMRDRVLACGGSLEAGPNSAGGWLVQALLPARPA